MTRLLLCSCIGLFFVMLAGKTASQVRFSVNAGKPVGFPKGEFSNLMDFDEQFYYFLRLNDKTQFVFNAAEPPAIEVFDKQLNFVRSIPLIIKTEVKLKKTDPVAFYKLDTGFVFLLKSYSALSKVLKSYLFKTDENGKMIGEMLSPTEVNDVGTSISDFTFFQMNRIVRNDQPQFVFSIKTPPEMDVAERVNLMFFDKNLTMEGERLINFPDDYLNYKFSDLVFGNSGISFFRVEISNPFLMDKTVHQLVVYNMITDTHQSLEFKFAEGEIAQSDLVKMNEQTAGFLGFFTKDEKDKKIAGVFYYLFNLSDGSLINHNIFTLDDEILGKFDPKNLNSKSDYQHLIPAGIHLTRSGHVFLLFEYNWKGIMLIRDQEGKVYNQPVFNANEVFVLEFDQQDKLLHSLVIPKVQTNGFDKAGLGIFSQVNGDNLFVLYNDHPKNIHQYDPSKMKTMKMDYEAVIAVCDFENTGYQKSPVVQSGLRVLLNPASVHRVSENSLLFLQKNQGVTVVEMVFD